MDNRQTLKNKNFVITGYTRSNKVEKLDVIEFKPSDFYSIVFNYKETLPRLGWVNYHVTLEPQLSSVNYK